MILIVSLSSGAMPKDDGWVSTPLNVIDQRWGAPGGDVRVAATKILFDQFGDMGFLPMIFLPGGYGDDIKSEAPRPKESERVKQELVKCGVRPGIILCEYRSTNTYTQLLAVRDFVNRVRAERVMVVTSQYHIGRIQAMLENFPTLQGFKPPPELISAEQVVIDHDPVKWSEYIASCYDSAGLQEVIQKENQGIADLISGNYKFSTDR